MLNIIRNNNKGFSLVELLVAIAVFGILAAGVFRVVTSNYSNFYGTGDRQAVTEFAKEGAEAVRAIRNASWQTIEDQSPSTDLGVRQVNGVWTFSGTGNTSGALTRVIQIDDVSRDVDGNIVDTGGTVDPLTKKASITVSGDGIEDYVLIIYISNWATKSWLQTDWSGFGLRDFWSSTTMASSFTNIGTSTVGEVFLSGDYYTNSKIIIIDNTKVSGASNIVNFPILISTTLDSLKTISHGGDVTNENGYDIIFSSDVSGLTQLDHEIESYSSTTGKIVMWVEIPLLDYNDDTSFYMFYGNSNVITSQENVTGVWDVSYRAVLHMAEDPSVSTDCAGGSGTVEICDSTSNDNDADANGSMTNSDLIDAQIGEGLDLDGSNDYLSIVDSSSLDAATGAGQARTVSFWLNITNAVDNKIITEKSNFSGNHFWIQTQGTAGDIIGGVSAAGSYLDSNPAPGEGSWKYISMTFIKSVNVGYFYIDGVVNNGPVGMTAPADNNDPFLIGGDGAGNEIDASFDELRISSIARSADWIATEYNNQSSPETFYSIGNNDNFLYKREITIDNTKVSGGSDISDYPLFFTTTSDSFKTAFNGGNVRNNNGYDIIFSSDSSGDTKLDHEIESYSSTTGALSMWVKIPTLGYGSDTSIYMHYGSSTISSSQENVASLWSDYAMVYHLGEPVGTTGTDSVTDSTGNTAGTPSAGLVFGSSGKNSTAVDFSSGTGISAGTVGAPVLTAETSVSFWAYVNDYTSPARQNIFDQAYGGWGTMNMETVGQIRAYMGSNGGNAASYYSYTNNSYFTTGTWIYVTFVRNPVGYAYTWYKNGSFRYASTYDNASPVINSRTFTIGDGYVNPFNGIMDEFRVANVVRDADWVATEYNNLNSPSTFYSTGAEAENVGDLVLVGGYDTPGTVISSIFDLGSTDQNLNTINIEQNIPSSCDITLTLKTDDNSNFSTAVSEDFSFTSSSYMSNITSTLDGKRWLKYEATLTACGSGDIYTPTLYSVKIDYK